MRLAIAGYTRERKEGRDSSVHEWHVIGRAVVASVHGIQIKYLLERRVDLQRQRRYVPLAVTFHSDGEDLASAEIIHQHGINLIEFGFMILDECVGADSTLFFSSEENKGDGPLWFPSEGFQDARSFKHRHRASPVVERTLSEIP